MKKTFTKEEFEALTHEVINDVMTEAENRNIKGTALMAFTMSYIVAFGELMEKLFDDCTDTVEFTTDKEF